MLVEEANKTLAPCPRCGEVNHRYTSKTDNGTFNRCLKCQNEWTIELALKSIKKGGVK